MYDGLNESNEKEIKMNHRVPFQISKHHVVNFIVDAVGFVQLQEIELTRRRANSSPDVELKKDLEFLVQDKLQKTLGVRRYNQIVKAVNQANVRLCDVIIYL